MKQKAVDWSTYAAHKHCEDLLQQLQGEKEIDLGLFFLKLRLREAVCQLIMLKSFALLFWI